MNIRFLERWPTGRGEGWVAEQVKPEWNWNIIKVTTHNTSSLDDGDCECWPAIKGDKLESRFLYVHQVFQTQQEAINYANSNTVKSMENTLLSIAKLNEQYLLQKSKIIPQLRVTGDDSNHE